MRAVVVVALVLALVPGVALAQVGCSYQNGFKAIADRMPAIVGRCLDDEHGAGDLVEQDTSAGVLRWRAVDNVAWFASAGRTWLLTADGVRDDDGNPPPAAPSPQEQAAAASAGPPPAVPVLPCWQVQSVVTPALKAQLDAIADGIDQTRRLGGQPPAPRPSYRVTPQEVVNRMWAVCDRTAPAPPQQRLVVCTALGAFVYCS